MKTKPTQVHEIGAPFTNAGLNEILAVTSDVDTILRDYTEGDFDTVLDQHGFINVGEMADHHGFAIRITGDRIVYKKME